MPAAEYATFKLLRAKVGKGLEQRYDRLANRPDAKWSWILSKWSGPAVVQTTPNKFQTESYTSPVVLEAATQREKKMVSSMLSSVASARVLEVAVDEDGGEGVCPFRR